MSLAARKTSIQQPWKAIDWSSLQMTNFVNYQQLAVTALPFSRPNNPSKCTGGKPEIYNIAQKAFAFYY